MLLDSTSLTKEEHTDVLYCYAYCDGDGKDVRCKSDVSKFSGVIDESGKRKRRRDEEVIPRDSVYMLRMKRKNLFVALRKSQQYQHTCLQTDLESSNKEIVYACASK